MKSIDNTIKKISVKKNSKGDMLIEGSGRFFREQKAHYSTYINPCQELYDDQIQKILKNSNIEIRSLFTKS